MLSGRNQSDFVKQLKCIGYHRQKGRVLKENIISYLQLDYSFIRKESGTPVVLSDGRHEISGGRFYDTAAFFAKELYDRGIWNQPIVIRAEHRLETLILYLGALLSGNYYVPLPEDIPEEKGQKILERLHAQYVYTYADIRCPHKTPAPELLEELKAARRRLPDSAALYVIFTSGSTGEPKGIVKSHRSMIAFLESYGRAFSFSDRDVLANQTPFCFDASAKDFYLMLQYRMDFHIVDGAMFFRPMEIVRLLNERRVTLIQWVPSALSMLSQLKAFDKEAPRYMRKVFFVGESFPAKQLKYWQQHLPDAEFINLYGASEMAGVCCYFAVPDSWRGESIPLGQALPGQRVYLVDEDKVITEAGIIGELCVESAALADGYLEMCGNEDRFVTYLSKEVQGGRYYRTGDLAKYDAAGNLCFVSRRDYQIKHMGHRIELGEIEHAAEKTDGVDKACAVFKKGKICMYYQGEADRQQLQAALKKRLQSYMMPNKITALNPLPLNRNGKVDRMALQQIVQ